MLTVNSPVTASKPTWMVCSKSEGEEISGLSLSRSFFLPAVGKGQGSMSWSSTDMHVLVFLTVQHVCLGNMCVFIMSLTFLRGKHGDDLVSLPLLRYRRQRPRAVIGWLRVFGSSLAAHPDRGGGGLVLTHSAVTHLHTRTPVEWHKCKHTHEIQ